MNKQFKTLLLSFLIPGLGYSENGDKKSFYKTIALFFGTVILGVSLKLLVTFWGFALSIVALAGIYIFAAIHSTLKAKQVNSKIKTPGRLQFCFTILFILVTGLSFANRRAVMGFDIMKMNVSVMQPTVLQGERFLVDTWRYKSSLPKRGDIITHSFNGQQGIYLNRIIAIEGDKLEIKNGLVFLNGQRLSEEYILPANVTKPASKNMKALTILKGQYFVMGDNRDASFGDSRFSGTISISNIIGKITDIIGSQEKSKIGITVGCSKARSR